VLNKFDSRNTISEETITRSMGAKCFARIPRDDRMLEKVQLRMPDLWQVGPHSALARSIETLARRINARREALAEEGAGLVARLFAPSGLGSSWPRRCFRAGRMLDRLIQWHETGRDYETCRPALAK
jgi:hypothetical protein